MLYTKSEYSFLQKCSAWAVHVFTASGAVIGIMSLIKIYEHNYIQAFWLMALTIVIDATDGTLARLVKVKHILPHIDGALLDNLVDFLNYVITPAFFLWVHPDLLPTEYASWVITAITLTSAYQFCQAEAKTPDHFFKGFPCYWNLVLFYLFILDTSSYINTLVLTILCVLIFVPIKYVYPSRLDYLTNSKKLKRLMHVCSLLYGISTLLVLLFYPQKNNIFLSISLGYVGLYLTLSLYRSAYPLNEVVLKEEFE